jgi:predicted ABC-type ATPase
MKYLNVHPTFVIVAGPNGSGKTTFISKYLSDSDNQLEFLNYDNILKTHASSNLTFSASSGRKLLALFKKYQMESKSFVYETVLSDMSNWLPKKITELQDLNWDVKLFYLWLSSYKISQARVEQRVSSGGHAVPFNMIKTRYSRTS